MFSRFTRYHIFVVLAWLFVTSWAHAQTLRFGVTPEAPEPTPVYDQRLENEESKVLKTRVIYEPRTDTPSRALVWRRLVNQLSKKTGLSLKLDQPDSQLEFERKLMSGAYDIVYASPIQFLNAMEAQGYRALAKRKAQPLRALIVVRRLDQAKTLRDIESKTSGLWSLLDYSSSIISRYSMDRLGIDLSWRVFEDEPTLFQALASGQVDAISIAESSFYALSPDRQEQLKILWETPGFTPFAFAAHPRVAFYSINKLQRAMVNLNRRGQHRTLVEHLGARNGYEVARNNDWLDAREINVDLLNNKIKLVPGADQP